jgi:DNA modification methylase
VWHYDKPAKNDLHPTMKPVALVERAIRNSSKTRDIVLDPFGGSGSTLIACEKTGRQARLVELDPRYCDVIVPRWQDWAGASAVLHGDGRSFKEIAARGDNPR